MAKNSERRYIKAILTNCNTVWITYESTFADVTEYSLMLSRMAESLVSASKPFLEEFRSIRNPTNTGLPISIKPFTYLRDEQGLRATTSLFKRIVPRIKSG